MLPSSAEDWTTPNFLFAVHLWNRLLTSPDERWLLLTVVRTSLLANYLDCCVWLVAHAWLLQHEFETRLVLALLAMPHLRWLLVGVLLYFLAYTDSSQCPLNSCENPGHPCFIIHTNPPIAIFSLLDETLHSLPDLKPLEIYKPAMIPAPSWLLPSFML